MRCGFRGRSRAGSPPFSAPLSSSCSCSANSSSPPSASGRSATKSGGRADVSLGAFPAARLLWGDGDSLKVSGNGLTLEVDTSNPAVLEDLDRFGDVDIALQETTAGPFQIDNFVLTRDGQGPYSLKAQTSTSAAQLATYGVGQADLPGAGIIGTILDFTGLGREQVPVDLDLTMNSDDGRVQVLSGGGTVAGFPTGPLAELITSAITVRL